MLCACSGVPCSAWGVHGWHMAWHGSLAVISGTDSESGGDNVGDCSAPATPVKLLLIGCRVHFCEYT
jgi:hypothetical protein